MGWPPSELSTSKAATRARACRGTLVCIAVWNSTAWTPIANPVTVAAATAGSGAPRPRASASAVMMGTRQAMTRAGRPGGRIRPAASWPPTAPSARLLLMTPQASAPPRYRSAIAVPRTATGAR
ncbi:MAG TPA: hypothetical protein VHO07_18160 [Streptosporangiaceae bacterium]|jgi:hypothetical protein|nr:hypothetical protein [Streptosporangiaceae bacterium]